MTSYRRALVPGGTFFFTLALQKRGSTTLVDNIDLLRAAYVSALRERPVRCMAMVILPDHLHAVWTLPPGDSDYSTRWRLIKTGFSRALGRVGAPRDSHIAKDEKGIWQRRFWEHCIRDRTDLEAHVRYCWANPVRHGLAVRPAAWPYSSIHRDIRAGRVEPEWAAAIPEGTFGEP